MSVTNQAKRQGKILDEMISHHREQLPKQMRETLIEDLRALVSLAPPPVPLLPALTRPGSCLIAQCKKATPDKGLIRNQYNLIQLAKSYFRANAYAISVATDARYYQGALTDLRDVKEQVGRRKNDQLGHSLPILRYDFIFHPYQIYETRAAGGDGFHLIASLFSSKELANLLTLAHKLEMSVLVAVENEQELKAVLPLNPPIILLSNRNMQTFQVDLEQTARLRDDVPPEIAVVSGGGIRTEADMVSMRKLGVDGVLVGEGLIRSREPFVKARELVNAGKVG